MMTDKQADLVKAGLSAILALVVWAIGQFGIFSLVLLPEEPLKWSERLLNGSLVIALILAIVSGIHYGKRLWKTMAVIFIVGLFLAFCYYYHQTQWVVETNCQTAEAPKVYVDPGHIPPAVQSIVRPHIIIQDAWCDAQGKEEVWSAVAKAGATRTILLMVLLIFANVALVFPILWSAWLVKIRTN